MAIREAWMRFARAAARSSARGSSNAFADRVARSSLLAASLLVSTGCRLDDADEDKKEKPDEAIKVDPPNGPPLPGQPGGPKADPPTATPRADPQPKPKPGEYLPPGSKAFDRPPLDESIRKKKTDDPEDKSGLLSGKRGTITFLYPWEEVAKGRFRAYCVRQDGTKLINGATMEFVAIVDGCKNAVWYQYFSEKLTFSDKDGKELKAGHIDTSGKALSPDSAAPQVDGQLPYPYQSPGETPLMEDAVGFPAGNSAADTIKEVGKKFAPPDGVKDATKLKSEKRFWTYLICLDPYKVIGHFEWSVSVTANSEDNDHPFDPAGEQEPKVTWIEGK